MDPNQPIPTVKHPALRESRRLLGARGSYLKSIDATYGIGARFFFYATIIATSLAKTSQKTRTQLQKNHQTFQR
jgi:hypothetical protein